MPDSIAAWWLPAGSAAELRQHACWHLWYGDRGCFRLSCRPSTLYILLRPLQTVLGYSDGDVLGMSCLTVCGPATDKKAMRQIIQLQRSGQAGATKVLCYRRDGSPFW